MRVEPNEHLTGTEKRRDFHCESNGGGFEVEVTRISIKKATKVTGLVEGQNGACGYRSLTDAIFTVCTAKARQCSNPRHPTDPTLLAVATFHYEACAFCIGEPDADEILTGETNMRWDLDRRSGEKVGDVYETTELRRVPFLRYDSSQEVGFARNSISALVLCGLGAVPPPVIGVLHPNPARPFSPAILPQIKFCQVAMDRASARLHVTWPQGGDQ